MEDHDSLAEAFGRSRSHLRAVAFRMLGSAAEADDAVQDAWLRASRADASAVANLRGWLTTIVSRVCLEVLRARRNRRDELGDGDGDGGAADWPDDARGPADDVISAESVGLALLVVLERLGPAERVAFVLHDLFAMSFAEIGEIVERSPATAKKLASRARYRVRGAATASAAELARQRVVVEAFLAAARAGDLDGLLAVLAPDAVRRADRAALHDDGEPDLRGARRIAEETVSNAAGAQFARVALVNGAVGLVVAPGGRLRFAIEIAVGGDRVAAIDVIADRDRLRGIALGISDIDIDNDIASR